MKDFKKHLKNERKSLIHNINELEKIKYATTRFKSTMKSWVKHLNAINKALFDLEHKPWHIEDIKLRYINR